MPELLLTCAQCGTENFTTRGLRAHQCKVYGGPLPKELITQAIRHAEFLAAKLATRGQFETTPATPLQPTFTMPKHSKTTETTLVHASDLPDTVAFALAHTGPKVTPDAVAALYTLTEAKRADWLAHGTLLGVALLAKKHTLGHGKWLSFLEAVAAASPARVAAKLATHGQNVPAPDTISTRTLRRYTHLAKAYLETLATPTAIHGNDPRATLAQATLDTGGTLTGTEIAALVTDHAAILPRITSWIAGRTLTELLADLQAADEAATTDERLDAATTAKPPRGTGKAPALPPADTAQLLFKFDQEWADTVAPALAHIDEALSGHDPAILALPPADATRYWTAVAEELETRAAQARAAATAAQETPAEPTTADDLLAPAAP